MFSPEYYAVIPDVLPLKILFILVKKLKSILFDINHSRQKREIKNMAARQSDAIPRSFAHVAGHQSISASCAMSLM